MSVYNIMRQANEASNRHILRLQSEWVDQNDRVNQLSDMLRYFVAQNNEHSENVRAGTRAQQAGSESSSSAASAASSSITNTQNLFPGLAGHAPQDARAEARTGDGAMGAPDWAKRKVGGTKRLRSTTARGRCNARDRATGRGGESAEEGGRVHKAHGTSYCTWVPNLENACSERNCGRIGRSAECL